MKRPPGVVELRQRAKDATRAVLGGLTLFAIGGTLAVYGLHQLLGIHGLMIGLGVIFSGVGLGVAFLAKRTEVEVKELLGE